MVSNATRVSSRVHPRTGACLFFATRLFSLIECPTLRAPGHHRYRILDHHLGSLFAGFETRAFAARRKDQKKRDVQPHVKSDDDGSFSCIRECYPSLPPFQFPGFTRTLQLIRIHPKSGITPPYAHPNFATTSCTLRRRLSVIRYTLGVTLRP